MDTKLDKLEDIGFYTLCEARAKQVGTSKTSPLARCEILLTGRCNFRCPYCRSVGGKDLKYEEVLTTVNIWIANGLRAVRFSGGEPTIWPGLVDIVRYAAKHIERVAISTNGSAPWETYEALINAGANDFSISLDACCAADGKKMAGGVDVWDRLVSNIREISKRTYVTIGTVLTEENLPKIKEIVQFASDLGVADIRVIPAAQFGSTLNVPDLPQALLDKHPILKWRWKSLQEGKDVRGLKGEKPAHCGIVLDDMAVMGNKHYPCIIYLREGGKAIGEVGYGMMEERRNWHNNHNPSTDPICSKNCLDFCNFYNIKVERYRNEVL